MKRAFHLFVALLFLFLSCNSAPQTILRIRKPDKVVSIAGVQYPLSYECTWERSPYQLTGSDYYRTAQGERFKFDPITGQLLSFHLKSIDGEIDPDVSDEDILRKANAFFATVANAGDFERGEVAWETDLSNRLFAVGHYRVHYERKHLGIVLETADVLLSNVGMVIGYDAKLDCTKTILLAHQADKAAVKAALETLVGDNEDYYIVNDVGWAISENEKPAYRINCLWDGGRDDFIIEIDGEPPYHAYQEKIYSCNLTRVLQ